MQIRNKRPKRKVSAKLRYDREPPEAPNDVWAIIARQAMQSIAERDFLSDQLFDGSKIRILTIVDAFSKLSPAIDVRSRYTGRTSERLSRLRPNMAYQERYALIRGLSSYRRIWIYGPI